MKKHFNFKTYPKYIVYYLVIAYAFSFALWALAYIIIGDNQILVNNDIFQWRAGNKVLIASIISSIATLGPMIGYLCVSNTIPKKYKKNLDFTGFDKTFLVFIIFALSSSLIASLGGIKISKSAFSTILLGVIYFMLTSATEEFGWRGVLYPYIKSRSRNFMESVLAITPIWGFWHLPIVLIIFKNQGMSGYQMPMGFIFFLGSIFLMSYLHGWVSLRTKSIIPNVLLHGLHNWWPIITIAFFSDKYSQISILGGYIITLLILEVFFKSNVHFKEKRAAS